MTADDDRSLTRDHFDHVVRVTTRWSDNDMYGHLNNAVYYELFDSAINGWLITGARVDVLALPELGVVAESGCRFFRELEYPHPLDVGVRVERLGRSSITYALGLFDCRHRGGRGARATGSTSTSTARPAGDRPDPAAVRDLLDDAVQDRGMRITGAVLEEVGRPGPWAPTRPLTVGELELAARAGGGARRRSRPPGSATPTCPSSTATAPRPVPMLLGHEACRPGPRALGPGVTDLAVGQRVVMTFLPRCGECAGCATGGRMPCGPRLGEQCRRRAARRRPTALPGRRRRAPPPRGVRRSPPTRWSTPVRSWPCDDDVPPDVAAVLGCAVLTGGGALLNAAPPAARASPCWWSGSAASVWRRCSPPSRWGRVR